MNHAARKVTEADFRQPEFRDAKVEDYEFRDDGKLVRKDRWETGIKQIASAMEFCSRGGFEIQDVVESVRKMNEINRGWMDCKNESPEDSTVADIKLGDGSLLLQASFVAMESAWVWREIRLPSSVVVAWRF